jgi:thiol-disulfide isomerase/thioredoxin
MKKFFWTLLLTILILFTSQSLAQAAPEFIPSGQWFNSEALKLSDLKGKVVLVEMWTFGCYNCYRSIPTLRAFYDSYREQGFEIIGVHRPEFDYEEDATNVQEALVKYQVTWPVFQDNEAKTWNAYATKAWPTFYLVDKQGMIRYTHRGEISEKFPSGIAPLEEAIQELLAESL